MGCLPSKLPPVGPDEYHVVDASRSTMNECVRADKANESLYEKRIELAIRCRRHSNVDQPEITPPPTPSNVERFLTEQARQKPVVCVDQALAVQKLHRLGLRPRVDYEPQDAVMRAAREQDPPASPGVVVRKVSGFWGPDRAAEGLNMYTTVSDDDLRTLKLKNVAAIDLRNREVHERGLKAAREAHQVASKKTHAIYDPVTARTPPSMITRWHEVRAMTVMVPAGRMGDAVAALCGAGKTCGVDYLPQNAEAEARGLIITRASPYGGPDPTAPPPIYPEISKN